MYCPVRIEARLGEHKEFRSFFHEAHKVVAVIVTEH